MEAIRDDERLMGFGLAALLCALAIRLFVPAGFMWSPAADGSPQLVLCGGTIASPGAAPAHHMAMPGGGDHGAPHEGTGAGDHECAFAALGGALDLAASAGEVPPPPPMRAAADLAAVLRDLGPGRGLAAPPPPQRGPPATF